LEGKEVITQDALQFGLQVRNPVLLFEDEVEKTHQQRKVFCPQELKGFVVFAEGERFFVVHG